ncbi:cupin domain-containing protein [Streptomyces sp. ISL-66]|uniref:cupin domain-containing protein n=1 Tax=Streptomyces sp. ISL-66 TaxID=2819186 RepID=UPI001BE7D34E|nr:cupin domain-containing protein [Streptomyces sp. ISL-66]MBT2471455.1 cupin domain-containing protein [Streptomyces sp. ISL-66]
MARPDTTVNIDEKLSKISAHWEPKTILEANGLELKAVKVKGEFVWHNHPEGDELFIVVSGDLVIELKDRDSVRLGSGDMFVVPRGLDHRPVAEEECRILIMDAAGVVNTGTAEGAAQTAREEWI